MTLTGNNVITLRKLASKVTAEKGILPHTAWPTKIFNAIFKFLGHFTIDAYTISKKVLISLR